MVDQAELSKVPQQWRVENNNSDSFSIECPECEKHYEYDSSLFIKDATTIIPELTKTGQVVKVRSSINYILPFGLGVAVYYLVHQWANPPGTPLMQGVWIPVIAAVFAYTAFTPLLSGIISTGSVPIYSLICSQCKSNLYFAAGKKKFGLPIYSPHQTDDPDNEKAGNINPKIIEVPSKVSITRSKSFVGAIMDVNVFLNNEEVGKLKNGATLDFTTSYALNELTVVYTADNSTRTIRFKAEPGGSVKIGLDYAAGKLKLKNEQKAFSDDGVKAAMEYLARAKADHHFRMRVQKCIDFAEHLQLAESEGYSFTEAQLNEAKEWAD
jgi:hypothetical protein